MCFFMSSCSGTKALVMLRGSTWSFVAVAQTDGKEDLFSAMQRSIVMRCTPQNLGFLLSYFACSVHLTKWFGCSFFWHGACFLLYSLCQALFCSYLNQRYSV